MRAITAPTFIVVGDSDGTRPKHAVSMFRLRGGGVFGDIAGLPAARLVILPGTTHVGMLHRADWLVPMVTASSMHPLARQLESRQAARVAFLDLALEHTRSHCRSRRRAHAPRHVTQSAAGVHSSQCRGGTR